MPPIVATAEITAERAATDRSDGTATEHPLLPLVVDGLTYRAGNQLLMDQVSFRIETDLRTVILGPNGAGKSVLLRLLHGLLQPTGGRIAWNGASPDVVKRRQAMVLQRPILLRRSVAANIDHALRLRKIPRPSRAELIRDALAVAGLSELASRSARTLSGGEQQRLSIARAWVLRPDVLLLDEPTSNLDPSATIIVETMIRAVQGTGTKIIMTTHDIGQARRLADDIMFLHRGGLLEHAPATEFFHGPRDRVAARFLEGILPA